MRKALASVCAVVAAAAGIAVGTLPAEAAAPKIIMTVTSTTGSSADITWYHNYSASTLRGQATPYTKRVNLDGFVHSIVAENPTGTSASLTCTITYRGEVVATDTATGSGSSVACVYNK